MFFKARPACTICGGSVSRPTCYSCIARSHEAGESENKALHAKLESTERILADRIVDYTQAQGRLEIAIAALRAQPQIVYETLLEVTAWLGIPEKKRENFIKESVENVKFIINETLLKITERTET